MDSDMVYDARQFKVATTLNFKVQESEGSNKTIIKALTAFSFPALIQKYAALSKEHILVSWYFPDLPQSSGGGYSKELGQLHYVLEQLTGEKLSSFL